MDILAGQAAHPTGPLFAYTVERLDVWVFKISIAIPLIVIALLIIFNVASSFARKMFAKPRTIKSDPPPRSGKSSKLYGGAGATTETALAEAITALPPAGATPGLDIDRRRRAHDLLSEAKEDFRHRRLASCLDRCAKLAVYYADLLEGHQAKDLADHIKDNAELLDRACAEQANSLATRYLELADSWERQGEKQKSIAALQTLARCFPDSDQSRLALDRLRHLGIQSLENGSWVESVPVK